MTRVDPDDLRCPHCGGQLPEMTAASNASSGLAARIVAMRAECHLRGIPVTFDGFVTEADAAVLLKKSPKTLANRRGIDQPLIYRKVGRTVECSIESICRWLEPA